MESEPNFRMATAADVEVLIDLMLISSWGGIRAAWNRVRSEGETWRQRGAAEIGDASCEIGYPRFVVAEREGRPAGMILLNMIGETASLDPAAEPPEHAGAVALIKAAPNSVFVRELAVMQRERGRGMGTRLLKLAFDLAHSRRIGRVTLIVNDSNGPAHRLYRALGFEDLAAEPSVGHPAFDDGSMMILMQKRIG